MIRITGLVLVKETGLGIPNLVVAVLDSELSIEDISRNELSAQVMRRAGRRLSSVLTDSNGRFNLWPKDLDFPGNEPRPNLLLMVLAPEDVQDLKHPFPRPVEERVLYVSSLPRIDAGAEEAYVIRLLQDQVDRFQIPTGPLGRSSHTAIRELSDPVLRALEIRSGVHERLSESRLAEQKQVEKARQVARTKIRHLSALPPSLRSEKAQREALVITDRGQLTEQLPRLQAKAIADGLAKMSRPEARPTMSLRLTTEELADLGLDVTKAKVSGKVDPDKLSQKVHSMVNLLDLVRVRNVEPPSLDELERRYLAPPADSSDAENPPIL